MALIASRKTEAQMRAWINGTQETNRVMIRRTQYASDRTLPSRKVWRGCNLSALVGLNNSGGRSSDVSHGGTEITPR